GEADLYVGARREFKLPQDFVQAYGPTPDPAKCAPPQVPPSIDGQFAAAVGTGSATVRAQINPHYFTPPVGTTTYFVEYATAECIESEGWEGACVQVQPAPPGTPLGTPPGNSDVTTDPTTLEGLEPGTSYRFRFVAEGSGDPGERIVGVGGEPGVEGAEASFTTRRPVPVLPACPNDAFRTGAGAQLRDCRAYELVSPLEKAGGDVQARLNIVPFEARVDQSSLSGDKLTFSAYAAFQNPKSAPFSSQYLTGRTGSGWQTEAISPPQEGEAFINPLIQIDNLYRAFSPDLGTAWLQTDTEPVLGPGGLAGNPNLYRRDNGAGTYAGCTTAPPLSDQTETHGPQLQGYSADGKLAAFRIEGKLTAGGSDELKPGPRPINQAYACSYEGDVAAVHLVSVLPNGEASDLENTIGGPANDLFQGDQGRTESLEHAVSADGSEVFWTASASGDTASPGALYLRLHPAAAPTPSGECEEAEPQAACTVLISAGPARFWTAAEDGSTAIFSEGGELKEYEVAGAEVRPIAGEVLGLLGASEDASRIYFLSEEEIGGEGEAGEPNLYLYDRNEATSTYIATLSALDASQGSADPSPGNAAPAFHTARVTPDGSTVAFMSNDPDLAEAVAGYDNSDQAGGTPAAEIYRFSEAEGLVCVSCNPSGQRPAGRQIQNPHTPSAPVLYAASMLPSWLNSLYAPRVLSADGKRIFFEAFEPLSLADENDKADVYQWEALGSGSCEEADPAFEPRSQGCISLISSGQSPNDTQFVDASPSGDDVFIRTASSLVAWDPGQIDIYDARVQGGFPAPPARPTECEGESCPSPPHPAPSYQPPASSGPGSGNVKTTTRPKRCRKGTHKVKKNGEVRCAKNKKHHQKHHRKHHTSRRAAR
ncbi:MAG TPA: hypothetical protein VIJ36_09910, partial [Thermoanaerobaculia bacterium]